MASIDTEITEYISKIDNYLDDMFSILMAFNSCILSGKSVASPSCRYIRVSFLSFLVKLETYLVGLASWKLNYSSVISAFNAVIENKPPYSIVAIILNTCKSEFSMNAFVLLSSIPSNDWLCPLFQE